MTESTVRPKGPAVRPGGVTRALRAVTLAAGLLPGSPAVAQAPVTGQAMAGMVRVLADADAFRAPFAEGVVTVSVTAHRRDGSTKSSRYRVLMHRAGDSRIEMQDSRVRGQRVLLSDQGMWLYVPRSRRAVRITPLQRLMGQANYGDIGRMRWARDYRVTGAEDTRLNGVRALRLNLEATTSSAVYRRIALWVEAGVHRPLKAEFFLASGKKFKSAVFSPPVEASGRPLIRTITFLEDLKIGQKTVLQVESFREQDLPDTLFSLRGLRSR